MHIDFFERDLVGNIETEHDHAGNPREKEIGAGLHDRDRIKIWKIILLGGNKWPLARGKPSIESVFVAGENLAALFELFLMDFATDNPLAILGFEGGDRDTPRDLAGNIPVFEVFVIVDEDFFLAGGIEFDLVIFERLDSALGEGSGLDEPLFFEERLDDGAAFVTMADIASMRLFAAAQTSCFEVC